MVFELLVVFGSEHIAVALFEDQEPQSAEDSHEEFREFAGVRLLKQACGDVIEAVFLLREVEGFSVQETADLLGITPINVKVRLNRAKTMLQKQLERYYSTSDLYEFNLVYCDAIVKRVFDRIYSTLSPNQAY